ncbi:MAG: DNA mismatch repair endonuclease MutL [Bacillota bacterium]|jgi:DNA mismatch repair protein MutL
MNKIIVLERNTRDQIAAGEVAERPALIIKELVENAIDAGADDIRISLKESGMEEIRVIDNGSGIEREDIPYAFLRHATSKIRKIEDLNTLYTMGFRGEALASIAAVSKIQLKTKTKESENAWECRLDAGTISEILPAAGNRGTEIVISDLFFNTPARKKFLATPVREMREIGDIAGRIIIAYPEIRFSLSNNNKQVFLSPGNGDSAAAIASVYGREMLRFLLPLDEDGDFGGFIAHPNYSKPNRNYFHFYINRRYIQSGELNKALENAFKTLLPERRFPVAFINVNLSPDQYDINVHPNKLEVKFHRDVPVGERLYRAVKETLENAERTYTAEIRRGEADGAPSFSDEAAPPAPKIHQDLRPVGLPGAVEMKRRMEAYGDDIDLIRAELRGATRGREMPIKKDGGEEKMRLKERVSADSVYNFFASDDALPDDFFKKDSMNTGEHGEAKEELREHAPEAKADDIAEAFLEQKSETARLDFKESFYASLQILGQVAGSFIVACDDDALYLIDQHAAHERLLFNRIRSSVKEKDAISQPLLVPLEINLNYKQFNWVIENILVLRELGFVLEEFGENTFILREAPLWAEDMDEAVFLKEFADGWLESEQKLTIDAVLERKIMSKACKRAVKANQHLTNADIIYLFEQLDRAEDGFTCPHGRPISVKFTVSEIRRKFLRT